jgi:hypothetical protein
MTASPILIGNQRAYDDDLLAPKKREAPRL